MTGYGKGESVSPNGRFVVELRSVNNRYCEISVKLPRIFLAFESDLRKAVSARVKRGKVDLFVQWEETAAAGQSAPVNIPVARAWHTAFQELARELRLSSEIPLSLIVAQRNVLEETSEKEESDLLPQLMEAITSALESHNSMRIREGEALAVDLKERRAALASMVEEVSLRAPVVVDEYRERLSQRLARLLEGAEIDPQRLAQEVAVMADRSDITEEIVRLGSHFAQFDETMGNVSEPVGRKLDFLMQEFNREVNTIGSKANDSAITAIVVRMKAEMEKMREQVQNIE